MKQVLREIDDMIEKVSQQVLWLRLEQRAYDYNVGYLYAAEAIKKLIKEEIARQERGDTND